MFVSKHIHLDEQLVAGICDRATFSPWGSHARLSEFRVRL